MSNREIRVSPDGDTIAIRSDNPSDGWNAWACMNVVNGGFWAKAAEVETWGTVPLDSIVPYTPPEPEVPVGAPMMPPPETPPGE